MSHRSHLRQAATATKAIDDPLLNRLGLQAARTVAAATLRRRRAAEVGPEHAELLARLEADGYVQVPGFLPAEEFEAVAAAAERTLADPAVPFEDYRPGANQIRLTWRLDVPAADRRQLDRFFLHPTVLALLGAAERVRLEPGAGRCTLEHVEQRAGDADVEAVVHSDTFHATHKAWLFLTDVRPEDGPLYYYPGSHRLDRSALRGVYRESVGPNVGSRRIDHRELEARSIERTVFTCSRNTLVVANTFGYHGRTQGTPPGARSALRVELRVPPFRRPATVAADRTCISSAGA